MENVLNEINRYGVYVDGNKKSVEVKTINDLDNIPTKPGCYWIETTMTINEIITNVKKATEKNIKIRKSTPQSTSLITQNGNQPYIIYNGTHGNINGRIKEHLCNGGHPDTGKLGFDITTNPFNDHKLIVHYFEIDDPVLRDTIEKWWRYNIGWPPFCIR